PFGTSIDGGQHIRLGVIGSQYQHWRPVLGGDALGGRNAIEPGHLDIHHDDVDPVVHLGEGFGAVCRLPNNFDSLKTFEKCSQSGTNHRVIINEEHFDGLYWVGHKISWDCADSDAALVSGIRAANTVPSPGADSTVSVPLSVFRRCCRP